MRIFAYCALLLNSLAVAQSPAGPVVRLDVTVMSRNAFIVDLPQSSFAVQEDKIQQSVTGFRCSDEPASIGLVIDASTPLKAVFEDVKPAIAKFLSESNPESEIFVCHFDGGAYIDQRLTSDHKLVSMRCTRWACRACGTPVLEPRPIY